MNSPEPNIRVRVDPANPGQFFACCGLLELADRLWPGAEGWFEKMDFCLSCQGNLPDLVQQIAQARLDVLDPEDSMASALRIGEPFDPPIRLDWWLNPHGKDLKVWAGSMRGPRIARAMQSALHDKRFQGPDLFQVGSVVYDPDQPTKKVEPFYFDARRAVCSHSQDVGFSTDALSMTTVAYPAVEFLCLVGLQRAAPAPSAQRRLFIYSTWRVPIGVLLLPPAVTGQLPGICDQRYCFECAFRTSQRKHKAFRPAQLLSKGGRL